MGASQLVYLQTDANNYYPSATSVDVTVGKTYNGKLDIIGTVDYSYRLQVYLDSEGWIDYFGSHSGYFNNFATSSLSTDHFGFGKQYYRIACRLSFASKTYGTSTVHLAKEFWGTRDK